MDLFPAQDDIDTPAAMRNLKKLMGATQQVAAPVLCI
jgi:hypothetical protein